MCINPRIHPDGLRTPCHQCWQCLENRINDWVGRCIAEKETCLTCVTVTLTYGGGDTPESRFLRKSDTTSFFKALRNDGHSVRYFFTGEYGSQKGRSHWHVVLFWHSKMPHIEFEKNIHVPWWPHGHTYWKEGNTEAIRYAMKYINKAQKDEAAEKTLGMSRKPMLGSLFFEQLAERYIDQGLAPQRPFYKFRDVLNKEGKSLEFYMPPLVAERFAIAYLAAWSRRNPGKHYPNSEFLDKYHDKLAGYVPPIRQEARQFRDRPWMAPPHGAAERFDEKLNIFYCEVEGERLYWSFDERGQRQWQKQIVTEAQAEKRQADYAALRRYEKSNAQ